MGQKSESPGDRDWFTKPVEDLVRGAIQRILRKWPRYKEEEGDLLNSVWINLQISLPDQLRQALPSSTLKDEAGIRFRRYLKVCLDHCITKMKAQSTRRELPLGDLLVDEIPVHARLLPLTEPDSPTELIEIEELGLLEELLAATFKRLGERAIPFLQWWFLSGRPCEAEAFGLRRRTLYEDRRRFQGICARLRPQS